VKRRARFLAAGVLTLGSIGAVAAARTDGGAAAQALPDTLATGSSGASGATVAKATVTKRDLVERVTQGGTLGYGETTPLRTTANGSLTTTSEVGAIIQRGDLAFSVDGRGIQLFYGAIPFWRDLASGDEGVDVVELEANLVALGHATDAELKGDGIYDSATAKAVKRWQKARGVDQTGTFSRTEIVLAPSAIRVAKRTMEPGSNLGPAASVLEYTGTARLVTLKLDVSKQSIVKVGDSVQIDIPGAGTATGKITDVGRVATDDGSGQSTPKISVTIALDDPKAGASLDQAPVTVKLTKSTAKGVLAVPVQALLALAEGGYGVEVVSANGVRLTKVAVGSFADGQVEVQGDVHEGDQVVVSS
jgi:peptidoglycan hydrolase-like protein with peptidoglycan-binding domain